MANDQLTTAPSTGKETNTGSPQSVPTSNLGNQSTKNLQSGTANSLQGGGQLNSTSLSDVRLSNAPATTGKTHAPAITPVKHHVNAPLLGVSIVLFIVAIAMFWSIRNSAKTTTE